ncbi:MAG: hypothetical protein QM671_12685 [Bacillus sp. (in: firmicutes)]|uniref:hypothetical protein n=1 Tax=Bacillus sp. TaxID=1409 RepID=UPI0039E29E3D
MSNFKKTPFSPLINKSTSSNTLIEKHVEVKGTNSFSRNSSPATNKVAEPNIKYKQPKISSDSRLIPTKTAKMSPSVLLKINTLKPFIKDSENMDKASVNNIIELLIENYVNTKLTVRQAEGYKGIYLHLFEMLDK